MSIGAFDILRGPEIEETIELIDRIWEAKEQEKENYHYTLKHPISGKENKMSVPPVIILDSIDTLCASGVSETIPIHGRTSSPIHIPKKGKKKKRRKLK